MIESPCIAICVLDEQQICMGCFRSVDEITAWSSASDDERQQIIDAAEKRKENDD